MNDYGTTNRRSGFTVMELTVATIMLGMILAVTVKFVTAMSARRLAVEHEQAAIREAGNVMERLASRPWDQLSPESVRDLQLSDEARQTLPGAELQVRLATPEKEGDPKQIAVEIRWPERSDGPPRTVRVAAWKYRTPATKKAD